MFVFDATPLIYLATVDRLDLLAALDEPLVIPEPVYEEVVTAGLDAGHPDARRVQGAVEGGVLSRQPAVDSDVSDRLGGNPNLGDADVAVLAGAAANDGTAILDERYGRSTAAAEGIPTRGTAWLVLSSARAGHVSPRGAREVVDGMVDAGWYCSTDVYARIARTLESME